MPAIQFKCPEKGCDKMKFVWVPNYPQHDSEHNADASCPEHREKYAKIRQEHIATCERLGIRP